ncbi:hypothetical protein [Pseudonocardia sp. KRD291]|uniref:hypothetical protein n=1 Tax=Pseudonocardia sp. KRD291 TaxID=2792007 RepID=UPI001C49DB98|nr:hypothetical protein [Pseudonocardia sp. KRD291]MBW0104287.1 hypothetical protein [Pseudonocardia sp. KRD291]
MTALIMLVVIGLAVLVLTGIVIGVVDSAQRRAWRRIAAERRVSWEQRRQPRGPRRYHVDAWADEDTD